MLQKIDISFTQTEEAETITFNQDAVLVAGEYIFRLEVEADNWEGDGLFVDYIALLPDEYYEPKILKKKINEPCKYKKEKDGKCMMYTHIDLPAGTEIHQFSSGTLPVIGDFERKLPKKINTVSGEIQPFDRMLFIDATNDDANVLYAQMKVPTPGEYVFVMDYINKLDRLQELQVTVTYEKNGRKTFENINFKAYSCHFLFTCRQVGLSLNGNVNSLVIDSTEIYLTIKDASYRKQLMMYIQKINVIPVSKWNIELVTPRPLGVTDHGPKYESTEDAYYPSKPSVATEIKLNESTFVKDLNSTADNLVTYKFETNVHVRDNYVFVLEYFQDSSISFNITVAIESIESEFHSATVKLEYCPLVYGCRSLLYGTNGHVFTLQNTDLEITLSYENDKEFKIGKILAIPERHWSIEQLSLAETNLARVFIENCGFLIDSTDPKTSEFCKASAQSLVTSNNNASQCKCAQAGTVSNSDKCNAYGCQCQCKPHCIGKDCSRCEVGYYNWPNCKKCDCVGNTICHETTGECLCPKNTKADCLSCAPNAYGYHHISGCNTCKCHPEGTVNSERSCDHETGSCECKENITGRACDKCLPGFFGFPNCKQCSCDDRGTIGDANTCDVNDGSCKCKANVEGLHCDRCKEGSFFIANDHPDGCISCFCSNLVRVEIVTFLFF